MILFKNHCELLPGVSSWTNMNKKFQSIFANETISPLLYCSELYSSYKSCEYCAASVKRLAWLKGSSDVALLSPEAF